MRSEPTSAGMFWILRLFSLPRVARVGIGPLIAAFLLAAIILLTLISPWIAPHDPLAMNPMMRLKPPSDE
ncbi:ABC transporter permease, partial [Salmonella enterica subsp. enterica serovar Alachua]|nr:ABC transporter permease [Salmonella enterica subsp. enterica serovar Alachua]